MAQKSKIQKSVEIKLEALLKKDADKPEKEELQVLSIAVKYLAVSAKLDEGDWGAELSGLENGKDDPASELETE